MLHDKDGLTSDIDNLQSSIDSLQKSLLDNEYFQKLGLDHLTESGYDLDAPHQGATLKELQPGEDLLSPLEEVGDKTPQGEDHHDFVAPGEFYNPYY